MYLQQRRFSTQALQHQHHWRNQKSQHDQDFRNHDHETTIEADLTWVGWDLTCEGRFPAVAWLTCCSSAEDEIWSEFIWDDKKMEKIRVGRIRMMEGLIWNIECIKIRWDKSTWKTNDKVNEDGWIPGSQGGEGLGIWLYQSGGRVFNILPLWSS